MTHIELALQIVDLVSDRDSEVTIDSVFMERGCGRGPGALVELSKTAKQETWLMALELVIFWEIEDRMLNGYYRE